MFLPTHSPVFCLLEPGIIHRMIRHGQHMTSSLAQCDRGIRCVGGEKSLKAYNERSHLNMVTKARWGHHRAIISSAQNYCQPALSGIDSTSFLTKRIIPNRFFDIFMDSDYVRVPNSFTDVVTLCIFFFFFFHQIF